MEIWIFARETHEFVGILDDFATMMSTRRYDDHGEITITASAAAASGLLTVGAVIWLGTEQEVYIIDTISINDKDDKGSLIEATGWSGSKLLETRSITTAGMLSGRAGTVIAQLAQPILGAGGRPIQNFGLVSPDIGKEIEYESEPMELAEAVLSICKASGLGMRSTMDISTRRITVEIYEGADHTAASALPVLFSPQLENIQAIEYTKSENNYKNVVYVLGEQPSEEGAQRMVVTVGATSAAGEARREAVHISGKTRSVTEGTESRTLTDEEYRAVLEQEGNEYLAKTESVAACNGQVIVENQLYALGRDYAFGDWVTFRDERYAAQDDMRVQEMTNDYEDGVYTLHVQLGKELPTLSEKIKLKTA